MTPDSSSVFFKTGTESTSSSSAVLTDGLFGASAAQSPDNRPQVYPTSVFVIGENTVVSYTLPSSPGGYDITGIATYTGWADLNRTRQNYVVSYALESDPATFIDLATVASGSAKKNVESRVDVMDLHHVVALRFSFTNQQNGYVGYREIDVMGAPVPEPASVALLAFGGLGLLTRRRRAR